MEFSSLMTYNLIILPLCGFRHIVFFYLRDSKYFMLLGDFRLSFDQTLFFKCFVIVKLD